MSSTKNWPYWLVESAAAAGTRSGVAFCMAMACATAFLIIPAAFPHPRYSNIIAPDKISEVGLAQFFPASCGAVPCVASKIAAPVWKLILLPGAIPKPPTCAANAKESPDYQEPLDDYSSFQSMHSKKSLLFADQLFYLNRSLIILIKIYWVSIQA